MSEDPYLQYQPALAYTLPIQLLVNGISGTLLTVLLIHLLFTTQYHYPLAPLNYFLQLSSIVTILASVVIKLVLILDHCTSSADLWPYSLDYAAVTIPPTSWSVGQNAAWLFLQALNVGLSNITHIQFLTLLYPSRIEARLIIFVLGPLAVVSSALSFAALSEHQTVLDISDAIRNVLNSTLLLIFTISLAIWGLFVNRRRAWRFDGGTAAFGVGSLFLAMISSSCNFVAVAEDGIGWLQHLLFAAVLWQVWLGWWWWVGSGMGIGEVEDIMAKAEKKKRKQAKNASRAPLAASYARDADTRRGTNSFAGLADGFASGVTSILQSRAGTLTRRMTTRRSTMDESAAEEGAIEMVDMEHLRPARVAGDDEQHDNTPRRPSQEAAPTPEGSSAVRGHQITNTSETSSTSATPSLHPPDTLGQLFTYPIAWLAVYFRHLRRAHQEAAKKAAIQRAELRQKVFSEGGGGGGGAGGKSRTGREERAARMQAGTIDGDDVGWGLGRFGIMEHEEGARRIRRAGEIMNRGRLLAESGDDAESEREEPGRRGHRETEADGEWEDIDAGPSPNELESRRKGKRRRRVTEKPGQDRRGQGSGWSWWRPLKDWRLNDRQVY